MRCESCGGNVPLQAIAPKNSVRVVRLCANCVAIMRERRIRRILATLGCTPLYGGSGAHGFVYARCQATMVRRCLGRFDAISVMSEAELIGLVRSRFAMILVK